jgi:hypothetical protein
MTTLRIASLAVRCAIASRARPADCVRLAALGALSALAIRENSPTQRMLLGQMRGAFRRAYAARRTGPLVSPLMVARAVNVGSALVGLATIPAAF